MEKAAVKTRGIAFKKLMMRIIEERKHIDDDIYLFDKYTVHTLLRKPFKTDYAIAVVVIEGSGIATVNDVNYRFEAPCLVVLLAGQIIRYIASEGVNVRTKVMVMSDKFISDLDNMSLRVNDIYTTLTINPIIQLNPKGLQSLNLFAKALATITANIENPFRLNAAKFLTLSLFYGLLNDIYAEQNYEHADSSARICANFMKLMKAFFKQEHKVEYYASRLCISERYLSMCVKQVTGRTASFWINHELCATAKIMLRTESRSIAQISDELNFPTQSAFGKFFHTHTGLSPLSYRKANS